MAEIREGAANSRESPSRILLGETQDELGDLRHDTRPSRVPSSFAVVPLPCHEPAVPCQKGVRRDEPGDFSQELAAEELALDRQPPPLVVRETEFLPVEPRLEDSVFLEQIVYGRLLLALNPASDGDDQECPWVDGPAHDGGF